MRINEVLNRAARRMGLAAKVNTDKEKKMNELFKTMHKRILGDEMAIPDQLKEGGGVVEDILEEFMPALSLHTAELGAIGEKVQFYREEVETSSGNLRFWNRKEKEERRNLRSLFERIISKHIGERTTDED